MNEPIVLFTVMFTCIFDLLLIPCLVHMRDCKGKVMSPKRHLSCIALTLNWAFLTATASEVMKFYVLSDERMHEFHCILKKFMMHCSKGLFGGGREIHHSMKTLNEAMQRMQDLDLDLDLNSGTVTK